jgi:DNA/RNA endonuclease G (NUC1)
MPTFHISFSRQDATFYFLNVAPQWKKFNSGNWLALELKIRAFAQDNEVDIKALTCVF